MSVEKVKIQMISVPSVPKMLKHSQSEHQSRLPDIKAMKNRQSLDPSGSFKVRNMNRCGSLISPGKPTVLTQTNFGALGHIKKQPSQRHFFKSTIQAEVPLFKGQKSQMETTQKVSGFRMRAVGSLRTNSHKLIKTTSNVAFASARKGLANAVESEGSDCAENKSLRNYQSDRTQSTTTSSKLYSDTIPNEPNNRLSMNAAPLFKSSPGVQLSKNARNRTLKKPQKICALNLSQVMTNRWLGVLKN